MGSACIRCLLLAALSCALAGCEIDATGTNGDASVNLTPTNGPDVEVSSQGEHSQFEFDSKGGV